MALTPPKHIKPEDEERILEELLRDIPAPEVPSPAASFGGLYKDISFEKVSPRESNGNKVLYHYDKSQEALQTRGLQRHARPVEVFGLLADSLENKLTPEQQAIAQDMLRSYGEWLSLAWERKGNLLVAYLDPVGLVWENNQYVKKNFSHGAKKEFDITGKSSGSYIDVSLFGDAFVVWHYGRNFAQLPKDMREGGRRAQAFLPADSTIWPVGRGYLRYDVDTICDVGASRGVAPK